MTHPAETRVNEILSALRAATLDETIIPDTQIVPNLYFSWDSDEGDVALTVTSQPEQLCSISARVAQTPRWFSLNLELGTASFVAGDVLGVVARTASGADVYLPVFVRSGRDSGAEDTELSGSLAGEAAAGVACLMHTLAPDHPMTWGEAFHTLVVSLPAQDFDLDLQDLRVFVLPAADSVGMRAETLSSFGG